MLDLGHEVPPFQGISALLDASHTNLFSLRPNGARRNTCKSQPLLLRYSEPTQLWRHVASVAPRRRPVTGQVRRGVAMTTEAEVVKARFGADPNGSTAAAMTTDARVFTAPIDEVVMTRDAVHRAVFLVRKTQD